MWEARFIPKGDKCFPLLALVEEIRQAMFSMGTTKSPRLANIIGISHHENTKLQVFFLVPFLRKISFPSSSSSLSWEGGFEPKLFTWEELGIKDA